MAKTPESIGKYRVFKQLARGGMGAVYTAQHPTLDRTVIIKKLTLRGNADMRERFRREAQIMMDLRNDSIVDVYDHFREGSSYYIVLEYVDGPSLEELIRRERYLPNNVALLILRESCTALAYAHDHGVVHRDIKPGNILISRKGEIKLVDFGIATIHGDDESNLTREGMTLGTPVYMAPEQFQNTRNVDKRADIYSVGVVLYEMVTGRKPFPSSLSPDALARIQNGQYDRPRKVNPSVSRFVARLVRRCMKAKVERRVSSLEWVIRKIDRKLKVDAPGEVTSILKKVVAGKTQPEVPARKPAVRRTVAAAVAGLLVAAAAYSYVTGYYRELLMPHRYGALEVLVEVPLGAKKPSEIVTAGVLFVDDNDRIPAVEGGTLTFSGEVQEANGTSGVALFRSQRIRLPAGAYRAKIMVDTQLHWEAFYLPPVARSVPSLPVLPGDRDAAHRVVVSLTQVPRVPVTVDWAVTDRATGRDITRGTDVSVWLDGKWQPWDTDAASRMESGGVYRFSFAREGYLSQRYSLAVRRDQSFLRMDVSLPPIPGALIVHGDSAGLQLLVDDRDRVQTGGYPGDVRPIAETGEEAYPLPLPPGRYRLTAKKGFAVSEAVDLEVQSGYAVPVTISTEDGEMTVLLGSPRIDPRLSESL